MDFLAVVILGEADTGGNKANRPEYAQRRPDRLVGTQRLFGGDLFGEDVLRRGGDRVTGEAAIRLQADQRARLALPIVVFDDQVNAVIEGNQQVIALALGDETFRTDAGRLVSELVVGTIYRFDVQRAACGVDVVLANGVAAGVVQGESDLL